MVVVTFFYLTYELVYHVQSTSVRKKKATILRILQPAEKKPQFHVENSVSEGDPAGLQTNANKLPIKEP